MKQIKAKSNDKTRSQETTIWTF